MNDSPNKPDTINVHWTREMTISEHSINRFIDIVARRLLYWACITMLCWWAARVIVGWIL